MVETARGTVHEWQKDHMGHINIRAYMELFEQACWQFYAMLGLTATVLRGGEVNLAAVQQNIGYKKELYPGDTVFVRTGVVELKERVLRFRHELVNTESAEICADCEFTVVCLDPVARKARPFPPYVAERAALYALPVGA
ncbi:MAG: acyl-CoA thioesterase [Rhodocyclales bacterium]|nr:acyl-CoA thioesterase [Rhodocyclales bacterium]